VLASFFVEDSGDSPDAALLNEFRYELIVSFSAGFQLRRERY